MTTASRIDSLQDAVEAARWQEGIEHRINAVFDMLQVLLEDRIAELEAQQEAEDAK